MHKVRWKLWSGILLLGIGLLGLLDMILNSDYNKKWPAVVSLYIGARLIDSYRGYNKRIFNWW